MHGWLPLTVQAIAVAALLVAVARRNRRWQRLWLPLCVAVGAALTVATYLYMQSEGLSGGDSGLTRRCQILLGFLSLVLLFTVICLIVWGAARPYVPGIVVKVYTPAMCSTIVHPFIQASSLIYSNLHTSNTCYEWEGVNCSNFTCVSTLDKRNECSLRFQEIGRTKLVLDSFGLAFSEICASSFRWYLCATVRNGILLGLSRGLQTEE
jgi:hypothetical protein